MSDEPEPPALRLRPRNKPPSEAPASQPADSSTSPVESTPAGEASALRAKPRLSLKADPASDDDLAAPVEPAPPVAAPPPPPPPPPPPAGLATDLPAARPKPRLSLKPGATEAEQPPVPEGSNDFPPPPLPPPPPPGASLSMPPIDLPLAKQEKPKLKLSWAGKPEVGDAPPAPTDFPPPPPAPVAMPRPISMSPPPMLLPDVTPIESGAEQASSTMPTFMSMEGGASMPPPPPPMPRPPGAPGYPVPPGLPAVGTPAVGDSPAEKDPAKKSKRKGPDQSPVFKAVVLAVFLFVIGGLGYGSYIVYGMLMGGEEPVVTPASTAAPESAPSSTAGQLIEQARQAAADHEAVVAASDPVAEEAETVAAPVDAPSRVVIEETVEPAVPSVLQPSAEFTAWVSQARISGVREGQSPRAFINSILVQKGDVIDVQLGIIFDGVDAQRNLVIFKDGKGAIVGKKY